MTAAIRTGDGARSARAEPRARAAGAARHGWLWAAWLACALVLAQSAGFVHQSAHVPLHRGGTPPAGATAIRAASPVEAMLLQLVGDHGDEAQCLLYDQMSHGDLAPTASAVHLPATRPCGTGPAHVASAPCGTRIAVRARGPPIAS